MDLIPPSRAAEIWGVRAARRVLDYVELGKPRLVSLVLVTTAVGYYLGAERASDLVLLWPTILGTALAATGSLALNQVMERQTDGLMPRTCHRPLPDGRLSVLEATAYGATMSVLGVAYLWAAVGWLPAAITALTIATYLLVYTPLKRRSPLCTVAGAIPGALPPVAGWAAASGRVGVEAGVLFTILFLWQLPHSLAIAQLYRDDYAAAGLKVLPLTPGGAEATGRQAVLHTVALALVALLPTALGLAGRWYFVVTVLAGMAFVAASIAFAREKSASRARVLLFASLLYLPLVLGLMAFDRQWPLQ
ncbi:MAG: protoheme IX farnesyltransferase [Candidatus Binatia bacterium]|nr:MAG: protoheme IX farnesyltransferase [Candidatus Binatia bacterium]